MITDNYTNNPQRSALDDMDPFKISNTPFIFQFITNLDFQTHNNVSANKVAISLRLDTFYNGLLAVNAYSYTLNQDHINQKSHRISMFVRL